MSHLVLFCHRTMFSYRFVCRGTQHTYFSCEAREILQIILSVLYPNAIDILQTCDFYIILQAIIFSKRRKLLLQGISLLVENKKGCKNIHSAEKEVRNYMKMVIKFLRVASFYPIDTKTVNYSKRKYHIINNGSTVTSCNILLNAAKPVKSIDLELL